MNMGRRSLLATIAALFMSPLVPKRSRASLPAIADRAVFSATGKRWLEYRGFRIEIPDDAVTVNARVVEFGGGENRATLTLDIERAPRSFTVTATTE